MRRIRCEAMQCSFVQLADGRKVSETKVERFRQHTYCYAVTYYLQSRNLLIGDTKNGICRADHGVAGLTIDTIC